MASDQFLSGDRSSGGSDKEQWRSTVVTPADGHVPLDSDLANGLLIDRFESLVKSAPDRPALIIDSETLSLAELNAQANAVAWRLLDIGVQRGPLVALYMAHGSQKIATAIGVLKAGAAYVGIDQAHSDQSACDLLSHSEAKIVLADAQCLQRAADNAHSTVAVIEVSALLSNPVAENPTVEIMPQSLFNVTYTSGSTGKPKGVVRTHANEFRNTVCLTEFCKFGPSDRIAFMPVFWACWIFGGLLSGATLHPFDLRREGLGAMKAWFHSNRVTCYSGIVTGFRQFLTTLQPDDCFSHMRLVGLGGEPLHRTDVERFGRVFPDDSTLMHVYASTEHHIMTRFAIDRSVLPKDLDIVPIGFPEQFADIALIDENGLPVAQGSPGEITIRGINLSPGYWREPDLTERVWRPDPTNPGQRILYTGDLAIEDARGCLHGRGRADQQVKIRGYRVVLDEIESLLCEHPAIKAAAVAPDRHGMNSDRLIGYVVGETESVPTTSELRTFLGRHLPDHMVPSVFVPVSGFELTASGKVNRAVLPPPRIDVSARRTEEIVEPSNPVEAALKEIWQELLGKDGFSVDDDFFLVGGDSVMALTMFLKLEQHLGRSIPFESLWLRGSTIRTLAMAVSGKVPAARWSQALPLQTNGEKPILFVVSMVSAPVYCLSLIPHLGAEQPVYGLPAKGVGGDTQPDRRIEDMAAHCIEMMRQVQPNGPYRIMGHSAAGLVAFEIAKTLRSHGTDVSKLVLLDSDMPGTATKLAGRIMRKPLKAFRFAGSLLGQRLGINAGAGPVAQSAARSSAWYRYRPAPYAGSAILVMSKQREQGTDLIRRWRRLVIGELVTIEVPGDHNTMLLEPNVEKMAALLSQALDG